MELASGTAVAVIDVTSELVCSGSVVGTAVVGARGVVAGEGLVMIGAGERMILNAL